MKSTLFYKFLSRLYDSVCSLYFNRDSTSPRQAVLQLIQAENKKDAEILDVCTGTAENAVCLAGRMKEAKITGIDRSEEMLRIAGEKVLKNRLDNIALRVMDASKMEFQDNTFDAVLISLVLHEAGAELSKQILMEAKRVLKPDGSIFVVEWEQPRHDILKRFMFWFIRTLEPKGFKKFLKMDMNQYFEQFGLYIKEEVHCDYSRVMKLAKNIVN
jgi:demethylmenaquinone methyltransferase/2-methoxy-6-polyprenyl-1,4-benzoquinol methylase